MAGLFGGNYAKAGPGIGKDEPEKHSFFRFFDIYIRKFWKLIQINMIFFVTCVPFFIAYFLVLFFAGNYLSLDYLATIPLIGIAVMVSGFTYIMRNYAREEHAFIWMDYKDTIKSNWRQSLILGVIDYFAFNLSYFLIKLYSAQIATHRIFIVPLFLCLFLSVVFLFMQYYLFVMLITFELTIKQLLKNALIFSLAGLLPNIVITVFLGLLVFVAYIIPLVDLLIPFILLSTIGFLINFCVWPIIKRVMIPDEEKSKDINSVFEDKH